MKNNTNIMVATNLSDLSSIAYPPTIEWANKINADLHVLVVNELPVYFAEGAELIYESQEQVAKKNEQQLDVLTKSLSLQCKGKVHAHLRGGRAGPKITATANYIPADYIVMATSGQTGAARVVIGSVTETVIRYSKCSVLCVRAQNKHSFLKDAILVPTDLSEHSERALPHAGALAKQNETALYLLYVLPDKLGNIDKPHDSGNDIFERLRIHADQISEKHKIRCYPIIRVGEPSEQILLFANNIGAGVIVMATHGRTGLKRVFLGSIAESIVRNCQMPVLCVKSFESELDVKQSVGDSLALTAKQ